MNTEDIRNHLQPIPEEILASVENSPEKIDYVKKEYRSVKKFEGYLNNREKKERLKKVKLRPVTTNSRDRPITRDFKSRKVRPNSASDPGYKVSIPKLFSSKDTMRGVKTSQTSRKGSRKKKLRKHSSLPKVKNDEKKESNAPTDEEVVKKITDILLILNREFNEKEKKEINLMLQQYDEKGFEESYKTLQSAKNKGKLNLNLFFYGKSYYPEFKAGKTRYLQPNGEMEWVEVEIIEKIGYNLFRVKLPEQCRNKEKEVGRINFVFLNEDKREFFKEVCFAIVRRRNREEEILINKKINSISMERISTLPEDQIDRIMKLVGRQFQKEAVPIIRNCLIDLEQTYVHSLKKSVYEEELKSASKKVKILDLPKNTHGTISNFDLTFKSALRTLSGTYYFKNPIFFKILLSINEYIEHIQNQKIFLTNELSYPMEVYQFIETEKKQILLFLKYFKKDFFVKVINVIQRSITNKVYNFYKIDDYVKYSTSKMKDFIELINYFISTKLTIIITDKIKGFLNYLGHEDISFFKIKLITTKITPSEDNNEEGKEKKLDESEKQILYSPNLKLILEYIEEEIINYFVLELNKINNTTGEIYSAFDIEKRLFKFDLFKIEKFFNEKIWIRPNKILEQYRKYKEYCFDYNENYCELFIEKNKPKEGKIELKQFKEEIVRLISLERDFEKNFSFNCQFVKIELTDIESLIMENINKAKKSILIYLTDYSTTLNIEISNEYSKVFERLKMTPNNPEELDNLKSYSLTVREKLIALLKRFQVVENYVDVLDEFNHNMNDVAFENYIKTFRWPGRIENVINSSNEETDGLKFEFIEALKNETSKLKQDIDDFSKEIFGIKSYNNLDLLEEYYKKITSFQERIKYFKDKVKLFQNREKLFAFANVTRFETLDKIEREYSDHFKLFGIIFEENTEYPKWSEGKFFNLDYKVIKSKVNQWIEKLKPLEPKRNDLLLYDYIHNKLHNFLPNLKLIKYLLEPGLTNRHWKRILPQGIGANVPTEEDGKEMSEDAMIENNEGITKSILSFGQEIDNLKLIDLIDMNIIKDIDKIKQISIRASKEFGLENKILRIDENLRKYKFDQENLIKKLNDHLVDLRVLKNNRLSKIFLVDIKNLETKILEIIELLSLFKKFEDKYEFLSEIIKEETPQGNNGSKQMFGNKINKNYMIIEQNFLVLKSKLENLKYLDQILLIKKLKNSFNRFFKLIDEVEKNLAEFIEQEKRKFHKLYFLDTNTLIRQYNNLPFLIAKLFRFEKDDVKIEANGNQLFLIKRMLNIENLKAKSTTQILIEVDIKLKKLLKKLLYNGKLSRSNLPQQILYLKDNISFFKKVEMIMDEQKLRGVQKFYQNYSNTINENESELIILNKLILKNVLEGMMEMEVHSKEEIYYQSLIKFHLRIPVETTVPVGAEGIEDPGEVKPSKDLDGNYLEINSMLFSHQYGFEYLGENFRLPLIYFKNFEVGLNLLNHGLWINSNSYEFIQEFSNLLGKILINYDCNISTSEKDIAYLLKGVILNNAFCGILNMNLDLLKHLKRLKHKFKMGKSFIIDNKVTIDFRNRDEHSFAFFVINYDSKEDYKGNEILYKSLFQDLLEKQTTKNVMIHLKSKLLLLNVEKVNETVSKLLWIHNNLEEIKWSKMLEVLQFIFINKKKIEECDIFASLSLLPYFNFKKFENDILGLFPCKMDKVSESLEGFSFSTENIEVLKFEYEMKDEKEELKQGDTEKKTSEIIDEKKNEKDNEGENKKEEEVATGKNEAEGIVKILDDLKKIGFSFDKKSSYISLFSNESEKINYILFEVICHSYTLPTGEKRMEFLEKVKEVFNNNKNYEFEECYYMFSESGEKLKKVEFSDKSKMSNLIEFLKTKQNKLLFNYNYIIKTMSVILRYINLQQNRNLEINGFFPHCGILLKNILKTCSKILGMEFINFEKILSLEENYSIAETKKPLLFFKFDKRIHGDLLNSNLKSLFIVYVNPVVSHEKEGEKKDETISLYFDKIKTFDESCTSIPILTDEENEHFKNIFTHLKINQKNLIFSIIKQYIEDKSIFEEKHSRKITDYQEEIKNRLMLQHKIIKLREESKMINLNLIKTKILREELFLKNNIEELDDIKKKKVEEQERMSQVKMNVLKYDEIKKNLNDHNPGKKILNSSKKNKQVFNIFKKVFYKIDTRTSKNYHMKIDVFLDNYVYSPFSETEQTSLRKSIGKNMGDFKSLLEKEDKEDLSSSLKGDKGANVKEEKSYKMFCAFKDLFLFVLNNNDLNYDLKVLNELTEKIEIKEKEISEKEDIIKNLKIELEENIEKMNMLNFNIKKEEKTLMQMQALKLEEQKTNFEKLVEKQFILPISFYLSFLIRYKLPKRVDLIEKIFPSLDIRNKESQFIENLKFYLQVYKIDYISGAIPLEKRPHVPFENDINSIILKHLLGTKKSSIILSTRDVKLRNNRFGLGEIKKIDCSSISNLDNLKKIIAKMQVGSSECIILSDLQPPFMNVMKNGGSGIGGSGEFDAVPSGCMFLYMYNLDSPTYRSKEFREYQKSNFVFLNDEYVDLFELFINMIPKSSRNQFKNHVLFFLDLYDYLKRWVLKISKIYEIPLNYFMDFFLKNYDEPFEVICYKVFEKMRKIIRGKDLFLFSFGLALSVFRNRTKEKREKLDILFRMLFVKNSFKIGQETKKEAEGNQIDKFIMTLKKDGYIEAKEVEDFVNKELGAKYLVTPKLFLEKFPKSNCVILNNNIVGLDIFSKFENVYFSIPGSNFGSKTKSKEPSTMFIQNSIISLEKRNSCILEVFDNNNLKNLTLTKNLVLVLKNLKGLDGLNLAPFEKIIFHEKSRLDYLYQKFLPEGIDPDQPENEILRNVMQFHSNFFPKQVHYHSIFMAVQIVRSVFKLFKQVDEKWLFNKIMNLAYMINDDDPKMKEYEIGYLEPKNDPEKNELSIRPKGLPYYNLPKNEEEN